MGDMGQVIIPKSDQLNADDLIAGPMTIKVTAVTIRGGQEQPISISFEGDQGKPYKACKSMCRVLVTAWGADSSKYAGRSMTLFREPSVKWGGMEVGGIRISHMSDIAAPLTMALTVTRGSRKPFIVRPLDQPAPPASITADQVDELDKIATDSGIGVDALLKRAEVSSLGEILAADYAGAKKWLEREVAKRPKAGI
jgi:hypothetical protein